VEVDVGDISGVVYDALEFALQSAIKGTILENSHFRLNRSGQEPFAMNAGMISNPWISVSVFRLRISISESQRKELKVQSINID